ncbi:MAG: tRNA (adenosine(37)-N6)-threonylcarbamoyltransferase complex transferase subunit TsaD [Vulcanimicrobiota bacterium]
MKTLLAIESSCDETSIAVLVQGKVAALTISSQVEFHKPYGGVVPELASRHHLEVIHPLLESTLEQAGIALSDLDAIAVTIGPGLAGSLLVGVAVAKMLGSLLGIPVLGVNHMEGHLYSVRIEHQVECPFLCLVCSGGHTQLVRVVREGRHEVLGETRDDAAGEAFDKVAKLLGLGYPGGPVIDKLCQDQGDPQAYDFPRPMQKSPFEFSFSGLKTAVRKVWHECGEDPERLPDIAASFQEAVVDTLVGKLMGAAKRLELKRLAVVGGVACNSRLRSKLQEKAAKKSYQVFFPKPLYCTDNAAMIGKAAWELQEFLKEVPSQSLDVKVNLEMMCVH